MVYTCSISELLLIVTLIVMHLAGTQQFSDGTTTAGKFNTFSERSKKIVGLSSLEQLARELQENVFFKALLEKRLAAATGQLVKSLNVSRGGDKRQSLVNFLVSLLPNTRETKADDLRAFPVTTDIGSESQGHAEVRIVTPVGDYIHGSEFDDPKQSQTEMFADVQEGPGELDVSGDNVYKSEDSSVILHGDLDENDDLDSIIAQSLADDIGDEDSVDIHLSVGDNVEEAPRNFNTEKLDDINLISNVIRDIISDDSTMGDSDDIHVITQDDVDTAAMNGMNVATLDGIKLGMLNDINKATLNDINKPATNDIEMDDLNDNMDKLNAFTASNPTSNMASWDDINADTLHDMNMATPNKIYVAASNGINKAPRTDIIVPTARDINAQILFEPDSHQYSGVFAHDAKPSEILLKLPEKLVTLLHHKKLSEIVPYLLREVNAFKSLGKQEGAENLVNLQGDNSWLSNEKLLQLLGNRPKMLESMGEEEQMQPLIKLTEGFPGYYDGPYFESGDNLPPTNQNSGLKIDSEYLDALNPGLYLTDDLKEQLQLPTFVKDGVQSIISPYTVESSKVFESIPSIPSVNGVMRSPLFEKSRQIQSWLVSMPLKEKEYIRDKTDTLLNEYKDRVKDGLLQVLYKQYRQPNKSYSEIIQSQNNEMSSSGKMSSTIINEDANKIKSIDQIVFNMLKIDDLPETKQNTMKLAFRDKNSIANNHQHVQEKYVGTTNSGTIGSQSYLNVKVGEFDANKAPRRSKRSKEWPQSDAGSVNHKFRNKKLFLTQQFQMMRHEKSQETRQMAAVDSKMNQILPWGISVQSEVQDLYQAERHEPPLLSRDHEEDTPASLISGDNEANLSRDDVIEKAIINRSNSGQFFNSTNLNNDNNITATVNISIPSENMNLNNTYNESNLVRAEAREMEDKLSNSINRRNFVDYLQNETRNNDTALGNNSLTNNNISLLNSSVVNGNTSNLIENGTITNIFSRRELNSWNNTNTNISKVNEQDVEMNASLAFTNDSMKRNNNESGVTGGGDQGSRFKRDVTNVQYASRGGSNVEHVPSWMSHTTTKPTSLVRPDLRKPPTTIRPEQATPPSTHTGQKQSHVTSSSDKLTKTNFVVHDQHGSGYSNSKADNSQQFNLQTSFGEIHQIDATMDTQTRPPDTQGSTEAYITRYLREKENAEKSGRKRDLSSNSQKINQNLGSNINYGKNNNEQTRKGISDPIPYSESKGNYRNQEGKSGSTYADRFLQSKNHHRPTARPYNTKEADNSQKDSYKLTSDEDRGDSDERDSYKFTSQSDKGNSDQRDSYKFTSQGDKGNSDERDSYKFTSQGDKGNSDQRDSYKFISQSDKGNSDQRDSYKFTSQGDKGNSDQRDSYKFTSQGDKGNQRDSYKFTSHGDKGNSDQRDSYKFTSHGDKGNSDQRDSYKFTSHGDKGNQRDSYKFTSHGDKGNSDQRDSYKFTSQGDKGISDQRDSYKFTSQDDRGGSYQTESYKLTAEVDKDGSDLQEPLLDQQVSSTDVDGVQIQDLVSEGGDQLYMPPPEPVVVHYQPVITYYTPPIHYSQIPEYMDFTSNLFTPTNPAHWDTSMKDPNLGQDIQPINYPSQDQQAVKEPDTDQGSSIKNDPVSDQGVYTADDFQTDTKIYDSNHDQRITVNKQHKNQRTATTFDETNQWSSPNDQILYDDVQSNNWEEEGYYTNDYQNTQTGSGNYNQQHNFRKQNQRGNKNRKFFYPTNNYGTQTMRHQNQNNGQFINYSTNQNYKNTNNAMPYNTQKNNQYNKQRTSTSTSADDDMDDEAVLQFIYSQKKMNNGQSGMSSSDSQDYSSYSTNYQVMDSTANKGRQTGEDKMIEDIVEQYIYFKPKYGYGQSNNNKMG